MYHGWGLLWLWPIALHTTAYFFNVVVVTSLKVEFNKIFSAFEMVWIFVFNVYYGGVSPLFHEPHSTLVWKCNMYILLFYAM